jgi:outer membrane receptor protein involved in Fe transport
VVVCVAAPFSRAATVVGRVLDSTTSLPLAGVEVLVDGVPSGVTTDIGGGFKTEVGAGDRLFTFKRSGFSESSVGPVAVAAEGETTAPDAKLYPSIADDIVMLESLDVSAGLVKGSAGDLQNTRLKADVAIDSISMEQFSKFSAGDAAEALIRIPGLSVSGGEFAVIRGLSDRYGNTLLNGLKVPSPDPEKQAVQLDLFPAKLLDNIVVSKNFMPDLWGDTSGGSVNIGTRYLQDQFNADVSFGLKFNDNAFGEDVLSYSTGGNRDRYAKGKDDRPAPLERSAAQVVPNTESGDIGGKFTASVGDQIPTVGEQALSVTAAFSYDTGVTARSGRKLTHRTRSSQPATSQPSTFELGILLPPGAFGASDFSQTEYETSIGGLVGLGYKFSTNHQIGFNYLVAQTGSDTIERQRFDTLQEPGAISNLNGYTDWQQDVIYYKQRHLGVYQVRGEHLFPDLNDLKLDWVVQQAGTYQYEPHYTEAIYAIDGAQFVLPVTNGAPSPLIRTWSDTDEDQVTGRLDFSLPFDTPFEEPSDLKWGLAQETSDRSNTGISTVYAPPTGADVIAPEAGQLFDNLLINGNPTGLGSSKSVGDRELTALYGMVSLDLPAKVRLAGGLRLEQFYMTSAGLGQFGNETAQNIYQQPGIRDILGTANGDFTTDLDEQDVLPAVGATWNPRKELFIRLNYSQTVARPSFREVGAYFSQSIETGNLILGNPALQPSEVENYDLRVEWVFGGNPNNLIAISPFAKKIGSPIEKMLFENATLGRFESWANNPGEADVKGFEAEVRKDLAFLGDFFAPFSFGANYTFIEAEVPLHPDTVAQLRNFALDPSTVETTRRLFDQPEWIANFDITFKAPKVKTEVTLALYAVGDVLALPGSGFPQEFDLYERGYERWDLGISQPLRGGWSVKLSIRNLTDPKRGLIYDPALTSQEYERTSYRAGRDFSLSATCKF